MSRDRNRLFISAAALIGLVLASGRGPALSFGAADEPRIAVHSRITDVTVFPDRAGIVREGALKLVPGVQAAVFSGLPTTLIQNSLRATGRGTVDVKILGLETASEFLESPLLPEMKKLQAELDAALVEVQKSKNAAGVLDAQEKFLWAIPAAEGAKGSEQALQGKADPLGWEKTLEFLGTKLAALKAARLENDRQLKEREAKVELIKLKLEALKPQKPAEARRVAVLLEAAQAGDFVLSLSYTVKNARWSPLYTVRALPDAGTCELTVSGVISQKSGENWEGVKARLSTSAPAGASRPPDLPPWFLNIYVPRPMMRIGGRLEKSRDLGALTEEADEAARPVDAPAPPPAPRDAEIETAAVAETGLHLNFEIKRAVDVPSDGAPHKFPIDAQKLKMAFDYAVTPKVREAAFLRGSFRNTLPYPLLPGPADLFIGQDFVGSADLPMIAASEEAKLFFGEDGQVKVTYEQVKKEKAGAAFLGKTEKIHFVYRVTVQNLRRAAIAAEVSDRIPVSQNTKIEVTDVVLKPAPGKKDEQGLLTWALGLAPQEKKEILLDFIIAYPKDAAISGI